MDNATQRRFGGPQPGSGPKPKYGETMKPTTVRLPEKYRAEIARLFPSDGLAESARLLIEDYFRKTENPVLGKAENVPSG